MPKMRLLPTATEFNLTDLLPKVNDPSGTPEVQQGTIAQFKTLLNSGVKVYRALLTQSGTDAPVATVLENGLGGTFTWTRSGTGHYVTVGLSDLIGSGTAMFNFQDRDNGEVGDSGGTFIAIASSLSSEIVLSAMSDVHLANFASIEILVYP